MAVSDGIDTRKNMMTTIEILLLLAVIELGMLVFMGIAGLAMKAYQLGKES